LKRNFQPGLDRRPPRRRWNWVRCTWNESRGPCATGVSVETAITFRLLQRGDSAVRQKSTQTWDRGAWTRGIGDLTGTTISPVRHHGRADAHRAAWQELKASLDAAFAARTGCHKAVSQGNKRIPVDQLT
jgi:hypothetical protein